MRRLTRPPADQIPPPHHSLASPTPFGRYWLYRFLHAPVTLRECIPRASPLVPLPGSNSRLPGLAATRRTSLGDTFGSGPNIFAIEFVTIGDPGNLADPEDGHTYGLPGVQNFGAVSYRYRIGKYEISEEMIDKANASRASKALHFQSPRTAVLLTSQRPTYPGLRQPSLLIGSTSVRGTLRPTSLTPMATFSCGSLMMPATTPATFSVIA